MLCSSVSHVFKFGSRSHPLYNLKWPFCIHFLLLCTYFLLPIAFHALHERLFIWQPLSSSPQLEMVRFVLIFPLFCAYFSSSSSFTRFARAFRHWVGVLVLSATWNGPFCIHFSSVLYLLIFSSSSSFTRFARAFRHWAAVLVLSSTWNGPFCINFSSVLCLFFFFQ